jgi:protein-L-isoaspartate(D-aspartate) O-methyltransferase
MRPRGGSADHYKLQGLRRRLVQVLRDKGIRDEAVLEAIGSVKRHAFVESGLAEAAYQDTAMPIGEGQTISQPYTVAYMTELLALRPNARVLEVGLGSGYQAAILCQMGMQVFSIERIAALRTRAVSVLRELGFVQQILTKTGDGTLGWPQYAPFDGILVTAGGNLVPQALCEQLRIGGRMVIPVGGRQSQTMLCITRTADDKWETSEHHQFVFVPLIGQQGWQAHEVD